MGALAVEVVDVVRPAEESGGEPNETSTRDGEVEAVEVTLLMLASSVGTSEVGGCVTAFDVRPWRSAGAFETAGSNGSVTIGASSETRPTRRNSSMTARMRAWTSLSMAGKIDVKVRGSVWH